MSIVGKKKVSQQLVEFLLVVPFMVIILGILTEYAYALNINMTLVQGLKAATSSYCTKDSSGVDQCYGIYNQISPQMTPSDLETKVAAAFNLYLRDNNVPDIAENNVRVKYIPPGPNDQTVIFYVQYTYIPAFTLPNVYFKFLPDKFNFFATVAVPTAFLGDNSAYLGGVNSTTLDKIWSSSADFSTEDSFNASKNGILKNSEGGRGTFTFLVPNPALSDATVGGAGSLSQPWSLVTWQGSVSSQAVDMANGKLYSWTSTTVAVTPTIPTSAGATTTTTTDADGTVTITVTEVDGTITTIVTQTNGTVTTTVTLADGTATTTTASPTNQIETTLVGQYSPRGQVVFVHDPQITSVSDLGAYWNPSGADDLSPTSVDGALKRMVTLNSGSFSTGYYEQSINGAGAQYSVGYQGSTKTKLIYTAADNISVLGW